ncbi:hypothetical protein CCP3SC15_360033 [Gammaproteobacteria bacterium]
MILGGNTPDPAKVATTSKTTGKLAAPVSINGVSFDGSTSITISAEDTATPRIASSEKGAANGVAPLGSDSKIAATYLPAYVDDVVEFANLAAFPGTGSSGVIYVALDTGKIYRWSGTAYVEISPSPGSTDSVTEGSTNLYFTAARALAAAAAETVATIGELISGATAKATPVDADSFGVSDSAAGGVLKKTTWSNIKATLKTYFDTLYPAETAATIKAALGISTLSGSNTGDQTSVSGNAGTATKLATARAINGVNFDGSADINFTYAPAATVGPNSYATGISQGSIVNDASWPAAYGSILTCKGSTYAFQVFYPQSSSASPQFRLLASGTTWTAWISPIGGATTTSATAGTASALPALPAGYLTINIGGSNFKIPYYN